MLITLLNFSHNLPHGTVLRGGAVVSLKCLNKRLFLSPQNGLCFVQTTKLCKGRAFPTGSGRTFVLKPELQWSYNDPAMTKSWLILHMLPIFCPSPDSPLIISVLATYMACWSLAVFMFDSAAFWNVLNLKYPPKSTPGVLYKTLRTFLMARLLACWIASCISPSGASVPSCGSWPSDQGPWLGGIGPVDGSG